ncbi:transcriptional regulator LsrR, partial [Salmonella enterica subsp. enterica]|nr:transcriptional regulator LsrR [Salmonella enterica subsp. enterica]
MSRGSHFHVAPSRTYDLNFYKSSIMSDKRTAEEGRFAG